MCCGELTTHIVPPHLFGPVFVPFFAVAGDGGSGQVCFFGRLAKPITCCTRDIASLPPEKVWRGGRAGGQGGQESSMSGVIRGCAGFWGGVWGERSFFDGVLCCMWMSSGQLFEVMLCSVSLALVPVYVAPSPAPPPPL